MRLVRLLRTALVGLLWMLAVPGCSEPPRRPATSVPATPERPRRAERRDSEDLGPRCGMVSVAARCAGSGSPFWIDTTEVTVFDYQRCVKAGRCPDTTASGVGKEENAEPTSGRDPSCNGWQSDREMYPMNCVSWDMAQAYCTWLEKRLPTVDEWRTAACGCDGRRYPWGSTQPTELTACCRGSTVQVSTCAIGSHPRGRGPRGLLDAAGNVAEWTATAYLSQDRKTDSWYVAGGSFLDADERLGCRSDSWAEGSVLAPTLGIRCAADNLECPPAALSAEAALPVPDPLADAKGYGDIKREPSAYKYRERLQHILQNVVHGDASFGFQPGASPSRTTLCLQDARSPCNSAAIRDLRHPTRSPPGRSPRCRVAASSGALC
jgi:formylglycine-generating enzyme required for sulfatase activity